MIYELFDQQVQRHPSKTALSCGGNTLSYLGLSRLVAQQERAYLEKHPNAAIKLFAGEVKNTPDSVATLLLAAKIGGTIVPGITAEAASAVWHELHHYPVDDRPFLLLSTSGTTGLPKLIALTQDVKVRRAQHCAELYGVTDEDVVMIATPLEHSLAQRLLFTALLHGATVRILEHTTEATWGEEAARCTFTMAIPQHLRWKANYAHMRCLVASSAALPPIVRAQLLDGRNAESLQECYGASEVGTVTSGRIKRNDPNLGTPTPGTELRIADDGEIQVRTPLRMSGYFGLDALTALAFTEDGYFRTGDGGVLDTHGRLTLTGRLSEMIKVGAVRVRPDHVEKALAGIMRAGTFAVFGVPDDHLGEAVAVAVVSPPSDGLTLRQIQRQLLDHLDDAEIPRYMISVSNLPLTLTGKVQRTRLQELFEEYSK